MAQYKKQINSFLVLLYIAIYPFGQIPGLISDFFITFLPTIHLSDLIILLISILNYKYLLRIKELVFIFAFSYIFNIFSTGLSGIWGAFYFIRFLSYLVFGFVIYYTFDSKKDSKLIIDSVLTAISFIAILGVLQYLFLPDLRFLKDIHWDDHLGRLTSTFLDPAFTGIILVIGFLISLKLKKYLLSLLFATSVALTYSRSSFLALLFSCFYLFYKEKKTLHLPLIIFSLVLTLSLLFSNNFTGEGVNLLRTFSINAKLVNFSNGIMVFKENPVFGVGFNNVCALNMAKFGFNIYNHSCGGSDNSIIFILLTLGIVGVIAIFKYLFDLFFLKNNGQSSSLLQSIIVAIFVHSMFTNTFFYSFILGLSALVIPAIYRTRN